MRKYSQILMFLFFVPFFMVASCSYCYGEGKKNSEKYNAVSTTKAIGPKKQRKDKEPGSQLSTEINFNDIEVQGRLQKPNMSVLRGSGEESDISVLRIREDFTDHMAVEVGEGIL